MEHRRSPRASHKRNEVDQERLEEAARALTVATARYEQASGRPLAEIADSLGVPVGTLRRWLWLSRPARGFRPVAVADPVLKNGNDLVLTTSRGHRVEGLDLEGVIALLSALEGRA